VIGETRPLRNAIVDELERAHGLDPTEASRRAADMEPALRARFATWVRRELVIRRRAEYKASRRELQREVIADSGREFERLNIALRLQHGIMALSVVVLIVTGLPLKFHEYAGAKAIVDFLGGPDVTPIIHRVGAAFLIAVGLWHVGYVLFTRTGWRNFLQILPKPKDAVDAFKQISYYLGRTNDRPRFGRFSYIEKFDYWAVYWGMVIMISTGITLWFTDFFLRHFPKWATDIAKEAHSDEALLATLAIIIWHFYNVHLNPHKFPMNKTFLTGKISEREMIEEHPLEYERLMAAERATGEEARGTGGSSR
jgi:formate dehydrogenase subunit gamma